MSDIKSPFYSRMFCAPDPLDAQNMRDIFAIVRHQLKHPPHDFIKQRKIIARYGLSSEDEPQLSFVRGEAALMREFQKKQVTELGMHARIQDTGVNANVVCSNKFLRFEFFYAVDPKLVPQVPKVLNPNDQIHFETWYKNIDFALDMHAELTPVS